MEFFENFLNFKGQLVLKTYYCVKLKGPGYAILGNFGTDQIVIELTKISK